MANVDEFTFLNRRNQRLHCVSYLPEEQAFPFCVLIWHHGYGEHSSRYRPVMKRMADNGVAIFTYDCHGHGQSDPASPRALVNKFEYLVDDIEMYYNIVMQRVVQRYGKLLPVFFGGQSLGALVCIHAVLRSHSHQPCAGLLLHSAVLNVVWTPMLKVQAFFGTILSKLFPKARIVKAVKPSAMSEDPDVVRDYTADPLNFVGKVRVRTAHEILKGFRSLTGREHLITVPVYAVHGKCDKTTCANAVRNFCLLVKSDNVCFTEVPDTYHEMLMGKHREFHAINMVVWLKQTACKLAHESSATTD